MFFLILFNKDILVREVRAVSTGMLLFAITGTDSEVFSSASHSR